MKKKLRVAGYIYSLILLWAMIPAHVYPDESQTCGQSPVSWGNAVTEVTTTLMWKKVDFFELAAEAISTKPKTAPEAMFKLELLLRGGLTKDAVDSVRELQELCPNLDGDQVEGIFAQASARYSAWEVARTIAESFSDNVKRLDAVNGLLKHFLESGWSVEKVDEWLAGLRFGKYNFWLMKRVTFNEEHGRHGVLINELLEKSKQNPGDSQGVFNLLDALIYSGSKQVDLSWMPETVFPETATDADRIASLLKRISKWNEAITFFRKSIEIPLTLKELYELQLERQIVLSREAIQAGFEAQVREEMADCLTQLGRSHEADKWLLEAFNIRKKVNFGPVGSAQNVQDPRSWQLPERSLPLLKFAFEHDRMSRDITAALLFWRLMQEPMRMPYEFGKR